MQREQHQQSSRESLSALQPRRAPHLQQLRRIRTVGSSVPRLTSRQRAKASRCSLRSTAACFLRSQAIFITTLCHFGAKFSAYWWQCAGSQMLRIVHALLATFSRRAWLYVDDLLALLCRHSVPQQATVMPFFFAHLNAPISWRKAQLGNIVTWCGWTLHSDLEASHLAIGKLRKLQDQLEQLARSKKLPRKHFERALGLFMWATSTCAHLRPYVEPLYRDLYCGTAAKAPCVASWTHSAPQQSFRASHWACGLPQERSCSKWDLKRSPTRPRIAPSHQPQRVRLADPMRSEIHLRNESLRAALPLIVLFARPASLCSSSTAIALRGSG